MTNYKHFCTPRVSSFVCLASVIIYPMNFMSRAIFVILLEIKKINKL